MIRVRDARADLFFLFCVGWACTYSSHPQPLLPSWPELTAGSLTRCSCQCVRLAFFTLSLSLSVSLSLFLSLWQCCHVCLLSSFRGQLSLREPCQCFIFVDLGAPRHADVFICDYIWVSVSAVVCVCALLTAPPVSRSHESLRDCFAF